MTPEALQIPQHNYSIFRHRLPNSNYLGDCSNSGVKTNNTELVILDTIRR